MGEHTQGKQRITPLPSRVRHTRSLYLLTDDTQAARRQRHSQVSTPTRTPKWISSWTKAACHLAVRVQPPRWRSMPQAPNMVDEPFKIVIAGAKHTHVRDEQQFHRCDVQLTLPSLQIPFASHTPLHPPQQIASTAPAPVCLSFFSPIPAPRPPPTRIGTIGMSRACACSRSKSEAIALHCRASV